MPITSHNFNSEPTYRDGSTTIIIPDHHHYRHWHYRIKFILSLHVCLDEEDVVDGFLDHKGQSSRLRGLRPKVSQFWICFHFLSVWWKSEIDYFSDPEISFWKPLNMESRWFFSCPFSCKEIHLSNCSRKVFYHLVGGVDNASCAAIVVYTWHRSAIQLKTNQAQGPRIIWVFK